MTLRARATVEISGPVYAMLSPDAAAYLVDRWPEAVRALERYGLSLMGNEQTSSAGRQIVHSAQQLLQAAYVQSEVRRAALDPPAEPSVETVDSDAWITVDEARALLPNQPSAEYVRRLARDPDSPIVAIRGKGRTHRILKSSVVDASLGQERAPGVS